VRNANVTGQPLAASLFFRPFVLSAPVLFAALQGDAAAAPETKLQQSIFHAAAFRHTIHAMFGAHLSIAGGLVNALHEAKRLKMDCVQIFTRNQRQWMPKDLEQAEIDEWLAVLTKMRWNGSGSDVDTPARVVSHNSYLINLASPDPDLWKRSVEAQRREIERCEALQIPYCVAHPGAHLTGSRPVGSPNDLEREPSRDELAGLKRIAKAIDRIHADLPGYRTVTCLETTVGSGTNLGYAFHHLALIRSLVKQPERVAYCFDTCHVTAAGYDMTTPRKAEAVLEQWDAVCGLQHIAVVHVNDSSGKVGSRRDRHAHIGQGCCGTSCFKAIVNRPELQFVPKILETPKGQNDKGVDWDTVNLKRLRAMARRPTMSR